MSSSNYNLILSLIRHHTPALIASQLIGVQPMSGPTGSIFTLRHRYGFGYDKQRLTHRHGAAYSIFGVGLILFLISLPFAVLGSDVGTVLAFIAFSTMFVGLERIHPTFLQRYMKACHKWKKWIRFRVWHEDNQTTVI